MRCLAALIMVVTLVAPARAVIDESITQTAWRMTFGVTPSQLSNSTWMSQDSDSDGQRNVDECVAGTNPFLGNSRVVISSLSLNGSMVQITFPTVIGKRYFLQKNGNVANSAGWSTVITALVIGDGNPRSLNVAKEARCFYRVLVQDYDTDGDDVSDYAEQTFHFNPTSWYTGGPGAPADRLAILSALGQPNVVTVSPDGPVATEDGLKPGMIVVRRTGSFDSLTLPISITGNAIPGLDYDALPAVVTLPVGVNSVSIPVTPKADVLPEGGEVVTVAPTAGAGFTVNGPASASVLIADSTAPTGTGLTGEYFDTASTTYASADNFNPSQLKVTRIDPTIDFNWMTGTPNGAVVSGVNSADNYSVVWEGNLHPTSPGAYSFQLDADDKARVLLDLNDGNGLREIIEHGWNAPATVGTFKQSLAFNLVVPASPAARYRIRVEYVETTGDARCRLQWRAGTAVYANILQANVFTHTQTLAITGYSFTRASATNGTAVVTTSAAHPFVLGDTVQLTFTTGNLFGPLSYSGPYTITAATSTTFTVAVAGSNLPANGTGTGLVQNPASATTGWLARYYPNSTFADSPTLVRVDPNVTDGNNGIWGAGSPDPSIAADTFSVRWTGQVQPQFSETYTFVVNADDSARLWINGRPQTLLLASAANANGTYSYNSATGQAVITNTSIPANSFVVGELVRVDPTSGSLSALAYADYVITAVTPTTFTISVPGTFATGAGNCTIEWANKPIDWPSNTTLDRYVRIPMQGGTRYDIKLEYFENVLTAVCRLFWFSPSQARQVVPQARLYPAVGPQAPSTFVTPTKVTALVGGPFTYAVSGSNGGTVSMSGNPAWLTLNNGVLTGTPPIGAQGNFQVVVSVTNAAGSSSSILDLNVQAAGGSVGRDYWNSVPGATVADIPTGTAPTGSENLTSLEGLTDAGDDYGARIRGYITAPTTGNYYFWLAATNAAELYISTDAEPVNAIKRATVVTGTASREWSNPAELNQRSPWLALEAGQRYFIEILQKAGAGSGDNLAVGWLTPGQTGTVPSEVVPGYVLSPYVALPPGSTPGTLYVATMLAQPGAVTNGVGTSTVRLSEDESVAYIKFDYRGLTGPLTDWHIHSDPFLQEGSNIIYDGAEPLPGDGPQPDGSHKWNIIAAGGLSVADVRELIKQGKAYLNLHTAANMLGEIRGNYALANGSRTFTVPLASPTWPDDGGTAAGAARFLTQATFGPNPADIAAVRSITPSGSKTRYELWIEDQFTKPASQQLAEVLSQRLANINNTFDETLTFNAWWRNSITGNDQLRQRVAFALSEIHVVSAAGPLDNNAPALSYFYDKLAANAFGNFRDILRNTTLTPTMGRYLDMLRNDKPDQSTGRIPNENYAREIMQLFSIGLFRMWPDGSLMLNSKDELIPTYTQNEIVGVAHVFTGWDYGYDGAMRTSLGAGTDWARQMREVPARHFTGPKRILNNEVLPGLQTLGSQPLDPYAAHTAMHFNSPAYQTLPAQELSAAHDQLFNHPNTGPFICRQLIQRLVTSNPTRDYLYRVVKTFNDNGLGVRGDMQAVIKAILLDYESRSVVEAIKPDFGKQREPVLLTAAAARAFRPDNFTGSYDQNGLRTITVTTTTPHKLTTGNSVFLDFSGGTVVGATIPWSGIYGVASITGVQATSTVFTVNATGWAAGTYSQAANSNTITVTIGGHWLAAGHKAFFDFTSGPAMNVVGLDGAVHSIATSNGETSSILTITDPVVPPPTTARTGNVMIPRFTPGSYTVTNSGLAAPNDKRVTVNTNNDNHLLLGDRVFLNFSTGTPIPIDNEFIIDSIVDSNTFTVLSTATGTNLVTQNENGIWIFPLVPQPLVRSGTVTSRPSTFSLGSTNADIAQTPLNSPTVFNFFLPDFKFPGALASQAITTPEFQLTSDTNVIRQTNFLFNGVFNPGNTNGISSFRAGGNALVMDLSPWMGNAVDIGGLGAGPTPAQPWTNNANLATLFDRLNVLMASGQLSGAAKNTILTFVSNTANVAYTDSGPSDTNKRDRIRAIVHLILTSADYTIQR